MTGGTSLFIRANVSGKAELVLLAPRRSRVDVTVSCARHGYNQLRCGEIFDASEMADADVDAMLDDAARKAVEEYLESKGMRTP